MPTWYSVKANQGMEFRRGGKATIKDPVLGEQKVQVKPLMVRFQELPKPFEVFGLPGRDGLARGILTPEIAVAQIRARAAELGGSPDRLPKADEDLSAWVCQKMKDHRMKGALFVEVLDVDDVEASDGDAMDTNLDTPAGMTTHPVGVIVRDGTRAYCQVCKTSMRPQGINGHSNSKKHLAALEEFDIAKRSQAA